MIEKWNPSTLAPPSGKYSHCALVPSGSKLVFVSGQIDTERGREVGNWDAEMQTKRIFANYQKIMTELKIGPDNLVKLLAFVRGEENIGGFRAARDRYFADWYPNQDWPTQSLAVVSALAAPGLLVEVEATFVIEE